MENVKMVKKAAFAFKKKKGHPINDVRTELKGRGLPKRSLFVWTLYLYSRSNLKCGPGDGVKNNGKAGDVSYGRFRRGALAARRRGSTVWGRWWSRSCASAAWRRRAAAAAGRPPSTGAAVIPIR